MINPNSIPIHRPKRIVEIEPEKFNNGFEKLLNDGELDGLSYNRDDKTLIVESAVSPGIAEEVKSETKALLLLEADLDEDESEEITQEDLP